MIGKQLDIAEAEPSRLHISYQEIDIPQLAFGIL